MIRILTSVLFAFSLLLGRSFYLMPDDGERAEAAVARTLSAAKDEMIIALYTFTNNTLAKEVAKAAGRGVRVTLIVDDKNLRGNPKESKAKELAKLRNVTVLLARGKRSGNGEYDGLMHLKTAVIDRKMVVHGSANWSHSAFNINHELLFIEEDPVLAQQLLKQMQPLIAASKPY